MAGNPENVLTGIFDGAAYWAPLGTRLPNGFAENLTLNGFTDLGFITDDGAPTLSLPGEGENTAVRVWQRAQVIRTIRTPNDESPTFTFTLAESTRTAVEAAIGTHVNSDGSYVIDGSVEHQHGVFVLDVLTAEGGRRYVAPNAVITEVGEMSFTNDGAIVGLPVTVACDFSTLIGGQIKVWDTALTNGNGNGNGVTPPIFPEIPGEPGEPGEESEEVEPYIADVANLVTDAEQLVADLGVRQYSA